MNCLVVISDCPCASILDLAYRKDGMIYTENRGCIRNMTCSISLNNHVAADVDSSEIPKPPGFEPGQYFLFKTKLDSNDTSEGFIDIFSYFGIICEDKTWFVTKYPTGSRPLGGPNEYNGKKSIIYSYVCL